MSPADAAWLRMENPANPMTITGVLGFGTHLSLEDAQRWVTERLAVFNRFTMRVDGFQGARPRWVNDESFSIERHVMEIDLPEPGGQVGLETLVSELMSTPLSFDKSPWEFHLVHDVDDGHGRQGSALIGRLHHVIGDGIALMHVLLSAADEYFDADDVPGPKLRKPKKPLRSRVAQTAKGAVGETFDLITQPSHLVQRLSTTGAVGKALTGLLAMSPDSNTVFKAPATETKRAAWTGPMSLAQIKAACVALDAKVNDVLLAVAAGALRKYLTSQDQPVADVEVRAAVPFNVRPLERAHELGNSFGLVFLLLPVSVEGTRQRVEELKRRMLAIKGSAEPMVTYGILQSIGRAPKWAHRMVVKMFSEKASAVMTNVPGPQEQLHIMGSPIQTIMFWVPQAGDIGLGLSILSLNGDVRVGVCADHSTVPNPNELVAAFENEFASLIETLNEAEA
ncbi:MAG: wax ester/triacylglycerol synthase family O-acyltransferase [Rubricoccaceae bacterium]